MAQTTGRLSALAVERARKTPGMHADGGGLYLQVTANGASWVYRFMLNGRAREMGLGPLSLFGLQDARTKALDARRRRHSGVDPIEARKAERGACRLMEAKAITFRECADGYIKAHRAGWRNAKHAGQWEATLATYADPIIGALPVQAIDTPVVMKVFEQPIRSGSDRSKRSVSNLWHAKPETASRLRGRIESILDWAKVRGYREGENPARWRGHLDKLLPARAKVRKVKHHAALPYNELADFMATLQEQEGVAARALETTILTAARTGEVVGARWGEIRLAEKLWVIPGDRMKAGKEHRVPLSDRVLEILAEMKTLRPEGQEKREDFVFPGRKLGQPLSNMAMDMLLRRMARDVTVHGFRSTFRDWAAERTSFPSEVAEMALAHTISSKVEQAYRRGDMFERRRRMMAAWATFCAGPKEAARNNIAHLKQPA
jgi:integrase